MAPQYIYTMKGLSKVYPPDQVVLKDIWLSFLPGAKIGVLGYNGAGKSTLLRIMAGVETEFSGEAFLAAGLHGRLPAAGAAARSGQDRPRQRRGGRPADQGPARRASTRLLGELLRRDRRRSSRARPGSDRRRRRLGSRQHARARDGRAAPAAARCRRHDAVGRRAPPRRAVPPAAAVARPAAARRTDQPPRRRVGGLARAVPQGLPGHGRRDHARSLLPRQRRRLDPRARSRPGHPVGGQLLVLARPEAAAPRPGSQDRVAAPALAAARTRLDPDVAARAPGQGQGPPQRLRGPARRRTRRRRSSRSRSSSRRARASATSSSRRGSSARPSATTCCSTT